MVLSGNYICSFCFLLSDHPTLEPRHFVDEKVVNEHHKDYMFLECIKFINEVSMCGYFCKCVYTSGKLKLLIYLVKTYQNVFGTSIF